MERMYRRNNLTSQTFEEVEKELQLYDDSEEAQKQDEELRQAIEQARSGA